MLEIAGDSEGYTEEYKRVQKNAGGYRKVREDAGGCRRMPEGDGGYRKFRRVRSGRVQEGAGGWVQRVHGSTGEYMKTQEAQKGTESYRRSQEGAGWRKRVQEGSGGEEGSRRVRKGFKR